MSEDKTVRECNNDELENAEEGSDLDYKGELLTDESNYLYGKKKAKSGQNNHLQQVILRLRIKCVIFRV